MLLKRILSFPSRKKCASMCSNALAITQPKATGTCRNICRGIESGLTRSWTGSAWMNGSTAKPAATCAIQPRTAIGSKKTSLSFWMRLVGNFRTTFAPMNTPATFWKAWKPGAPIGGTSTSRTAASSATCRRIALSKVRALLTGSGLTWSKASPCPTPVLRPAWPA